MRDILKAANELREWVEDDVADDGTVTPRIPLRELNEAERMLLWLADTIEEGQQ